VAVRRARAHDGEGEDDDDEEEEAEAEAEASADYDDNDDDDEEEEAEEDQAVNSSPCPPPLQVPSGNGADSGYYGQLTSMDTSPPEASLMWPAAPPAATVARVEGNFDPEEAYLGQAMLPEDG
jgi:hypothetical protein